MLLIFMKDGEFPMGELRGKVKKGARKRKRSKNDRKGSITAIVAAKGAGTKKTTQNTA
jgi:hypothetical protein